MCANHPDLQQRANTNCEVWYIRLIIDELVKYDYSSLEALISWLGSSLYLWIVRDSWYSKRDQWLDLLWIYPLLYDLYYCGKHVQPLYWWLDFASSSGYGSKRALIYAETVHKYRGVDGLQILCDMNVP
jgi:hypothetical protein